MCVTNFNNICIYRNMSAHPKRLRRVGQPRPSESQPPGRLLCLAGAAVPGDHEKGAGPGLRLQHQRQAVVDQRCQERSSQLSSMCWGPKADVT